MSNTKFNRNLKTGIVEVEGNGIRFGAQAEMFDEIWNAAVESERERIKATLTECIKADYEDGRIESVSSLMAFFSMAFAEDAEVINSEE